MQRVPGNQHFLRRVEFGTVMQHYFGRVGFVIGEIVLNICLQANNVASIVVAAQVLDDFLIYAFDASFAFDFAHGEFLRSSGSYTDDNPFHPHTWIISLGYIVAMVICIPFGFLNLDENMWFQWFSFVGMMLSFLEFYIVFFLAGGGVLHNSDRPPPPSNITAPSNMSEPLFSPSPFFSSPDINISTPNSSIPISPPPPRSLHWDASRVPVFGDQLAGQANVIGTIIFMSAFVTTVPSWVNEKKPHVSVNKSIWSSTLTSNFIKLSFGYLAGITYAIGGSSNILNVISRNAPTGAFGVITRLSVYLFNFATIIPGIPVCSILVRYNLVTGKLCPPIIANLIGVVAPWVISMFFYHGKGLSMVVNWSAILFQGFVNFAIPGLLYYFAVRWYPNFPDVIIETDPDSLNINTDASSESPQDENAARSSTKLIQSSSEVDGLPEDLPVGDLLPDTPSKVEDSNKDLQTPDPDHQLSLNDEEVADKEKPSWFYLNQKEKLRPVDALPRALPNKWKKVVAIGMVVFMTVLTLVALILDFYLLGSGIDIVDN